MSDIRVRVGPSPTGDPHVGTAYVALFNYAFAHSNNGKIILRIEDTDKKRFSKGSEEAIIASLNWLGLSFDEGPGCIGGEFGPYRQSERLSVYREHIGPLLEANGAYYCICPASRLESVKDQQIKLKQPTGYDRRCRGLSKTEVEKKIKSGAEYVVRLKVPLAGSVSFFDELRGEVKVDTSDIDDQILLKSDGFPTYHFANVVDDHLMQISHVIRGEEWISSTFKHVLLYRFFGWTPPKFCHLPLLRNFNKSKVSKRNSPVSINFFKDSGFLPEALINFLGLMAYSFGEDREIFSLAEFVDNFDIKKISLGGPVFDLNKLLWLNGKYIREKKTDLEIVNYIKNHMFSDELLLKIVPLIKARINKFDDFLEYTSFFFDSNIDVENADCLIKNCDSIRSVEIYKNLLKKLEDGSCFDPDTLEALLRGFCLDLNLPTRELFMSLRVILTGKKFSPPLFATMSVIGREKCLNRLRLTIKKLGKHHE